MTIISRRNFKTSAIFVLIIVAYFIAAKLGLKLAFVNASATAVWPPTGIAIAALLIYGLKFWPAVFIGAFLANITTAGNIATSLGIATGNSLEGLIGAFLVARFAGGRLAFNKPENIFRFTLLAGLASPIISATIGVTSLYLGGLAKQADLLPIWGTWWLGDASGALIIAPLFLIWSNQYQVTLSLRKVFERASLLLILLLVSWIIFGQTNNYPIDFIIFPILLWVAFRFGLREIVTATTILSAFAIWGTLSNRGPFARPSQNESLLLLQAFMAVVTITKAIVAAVVAKSKELDALKDEFVSMASHELRTPMAAISGLVSMILLEKYGPIRAELKRPLGMINSSTDRLLKLTSDLLDASKIESKIVRLNLVKIDLSQIITEVVNELQPIADQKKVSLKIADLSNQPAIADPDKVRQILHNLIGNALKFTKQGSITVSSKVNSRHLIVLVKDTGTGIAKENQVKIFSKFQQLHNNFSNKPAGTGLGLYISQELVKDMKGKLWLEYSKVDEGSVFAFSLPLPR